MKLVDLLLEVMLQEIEIYDYKAKTVDQRQAFYSYEFETPENSYFVRISGPAGSGKDHPYYYISFGVNKRDGSEIITNEGVMFNVMYTINNIVTEVWERYSEEDGVVGIIFNPAKKKDEKDAITSQRGKLYTRFIKRKYPNAKISIEGKDLIKVNIK